jgi:hypothetical protein
MSGEDLEPLTDTLDGLSDVAFLKNYIAPWDPIQFKGDSLENTSEIEAPTSSVRVRWGRRYRGGALYHGLEFPTQGTAAQEADWMSILDRCICHLAVDLVPDMGLSDIRQQLLDAVEFFSRESLPALPHLSQPRATHVLNRYDRESPMIDED